MYFSMLHLGRNGQPFGILLTAYLLLACSIGLASEESQGRNVIDNKVPDEASYSLIDGHFEYVHGNFEEVAAILLPLAEQGDINAQYTLGLMYQHGRGFAKDYVAAADWYRRSSEGGHKLAPANLAALFFEGMLGAQNLDEAKRWWKLGAERGDATCYYMLAGLQLMDGNAVSAIPLFEQAAELGDPTAKSQLATIYLLGMGIPSDADKAKTLYSDAAQHGDIMGQAGLGLYYLLKDTDADSLEEAHAWLQDAAKRGHPGALYVRGILHYRGLGVPRDEKEGVRLLEESAQHDFMLANGVLGILYWRGEGVEEDPIQASRLFRSAAEYGSPEASALLIRTLLGFDTVDLDEGDLILLRHSAEVWGGDAAEMLGYLYLKGISVQQDEDTGLRWLSRAVETGSIGAAGTLYSYYVTGGPSRRNLGKAYAFAKFINTMDPGSLFGQPLEMPYVKDLREEAKLWVKRGETLLSARALKDNQAFAQQLLDMANQQQRELSAWRACVTIWGGNSPLAIGHTDFPEDKFARPIPRLPGSQNQ